MRKIPVEVYSRVVGYFRPTQDWNKGKLSEFTDRRPMSAAKIVSSLHVQCEYTADIKTT